MYIKKEMLAIVGLTVTALLMAIGTFTGSPAKADFSVKDRDYQLITGRARQRRSRIFTSWTTGPA